MWVRWPAGRRKSPSIQSDACAKQQQQQPVSHSRLDEAIHVYDLCTRHHVNYLLHCWKVLFLQLFAQ